MFITLCQLWAFVACIKINSFVWNYFYMVFLKIIRCMEGTLKNGNEWKIRTTLMPLVWLDVAMFIPYLNIAIVIGIWHLNSFFCLRALIRHNVTNFTFVFKFSRNVLAAVVVRKPIISVLTRIFALKVSLTRIFYKTSHWNTKRSVFFPYWFYFIY